MDLQVTVYLPPGARWITIKFNMYGLYTYELLELTYNLVEYGSVFPRTKCSMCSRTPA